MTVHVSQEPNDRLPLTQWQPAEILAAALGRCRKTVSESVKRGHRCAGYELERRKPMPIHRERWPGLKWVYRVKQGGDVEEMDQGEPQLVLHAPSPAPRFGEVAETLISVYRAAEEWAMDDRSDASKSLVLERKLMQAVIAAKGVER